MTPHKIKQTIFEIDIFSAVNKFFPFLSFAVINETQKKKQALSQIGAKTTAQTIVELSRRFY